MHHLLGRVRDKVRAHACLWFGLSAPCDEIPHLHCSTRAIWLTSSRDATDADRVLRFARSQEWFCAFSAWISSLSSYSRSAYFSGDTDIFLNIPYVCDTITCADECLERARALSERIFLRDGMCACVRGGAARARPVRCLWTALSAFEP